LHGPAELKLGRFPFIVFADVIQNQDAADLDTGFAVGFTIGKVAEPRTWELGYAYQNVQKDAQFGQFVESDFGGGITDTRGRVFRLGHAFAKSWSGNAAYFINDRFVDVGDQHDYDRLQLDLGYRF
jgi:hypothetical protein